MDMHNTWLSSTATRFHLQHLPSLPKIKRRTSSICVPPLTSADLGLSPALQIFTAYKAHSHSHHEATRRQRKREEVLQNALQFSGGALLFVFLSSCVRPMDFTNVCGPPGDAKHVAQKPRACSHWDQGPLG
jgi:hypothetical protein